MSQAAKRLDVILSRLKETGILSPAQLEQARQEQAKTQERFSVVLTKLGLLRDAESGKRLATQLGWLPKKIDPAATVVVRPPRVPADVCRTHRLVPTQEAPTQPLMVLTDDPLTLLGLEWLQRSFGVDVDVGLVRDQDFEVLLSKVAQAPPPDTAAPPAAAAAPALPPPVLTSLPLPPPKPEPMLPSRPPAPPVSPTAPVSPQPSSTLATIRLVPSAPASAAPPAPPPTPSSPPASRAVPTIKILGTTTAPTPAARPPVLPPPASSASPPAPPVSIVAAAKPAVPPPPPAAATGKTAAPSPGLEALSQQAMASGGNADAPIIQLVDSVLSEASRLRASDIHIEPLSDRMKVRYRIDGVLHEVSSPPKALQGAITSRLKIMAGLNIAEKRLPQDGRIQLSNPDKVLDIRVSILPALHGESVVMRLLDRTQAIRGMEELNLSVEDLQHWTELAHRPYGMVLVTGPTGSGKTTTLYTTLAALNEPSRKLITVEDPVEYQLPGVNQVHVKTSIGLTFAAGLRSMLRQAPDVIMVGEIRDAETAQIAVQAALTGHLVFSTLHTNDAPSAVTRLIDMGVAPFLVASTIQGVLAQRLVRRVCPTCQRQRAATPEEQAFLGDPVVAQVVEGAGCDACHQSGYYGRIGIYELLMMTDAVRHRVVAKQPASKLRGQAVEDGMQTLRDDGKRKMRDGKTTMAEVLRATPSEAD